MEVNHILSEVLFRENKYKNSIEKQSF